MWQGLNKLWLIAFNSRLSLWHVAYPVEMLSVKPVPVHTSLLDEEHQTCNPISFESRVG